MYRSSKDREVWFFLEPDLFNSCVAMLEDVLPIFENSHRFKKAIEVMKKFSRRRIYKKGEVLVSTRLFTAEAGALLEVLLTMTGDDYPRFNPDKEIKDYTMELKEFIVDEDSPYADNCAGCDDYPADEDDHDDNGVGHGDVPTEEEFSKMLEEGRKFAVPAMTIEPPREGIEDENAMDTEEKE